MKCMDCPNTRMFYDLNNTADTYYFKPDGTLDYMESGEHYSEGWECAECGSNDVREEN